MTKTAQRKRKRVKTMRVILVMMITMILMKKRKIILDLKNQRKRMKEL